MNAGSDCDSFICFYSSPALAPSCPAPPGALFLCWGIVLEIGLSVDVSVRNRKKIKTKIKRLR